MKKIILDTSFILSCIRNKIDFLEELNFLGFQPIILKKILQEIKNSKTKEAKIALELLKKIKTLDLGKNHADKQIINYLAKNPQILVATLDKEILNSINNKKVIIRRKNNLEILS
jgi:rRNA-processing protein FCF1